MRLRLAPLGEAMTPPTPGIKRMPYGPGTRAAAEACLECLPPNDVLSEWLHFYLEHTDELSRRLEALIAEVFVYRTRLAQIRDVSIEETLAEMAAQALMDGELAALDAGEGADARDNTNGPACNPYQGMTDAEKAQYLGEEK